MKKSAFHYDIAIRLEFTLAEIETLERNAASHYDWKCKHQVPKLIRVSKEKVEEAAAGETEEGEDLGWFFSFREIDLMVKTLEMASAVGDTDGVSLYFQLKRALATINAEHRRVKEVGTDQLS